MIRQWPSSLRGCSHRTRTLSRASFSSSSRSASYADTIPNLRIGSHTRVIYQGFTGKQATANAKDSIAWGTNIVGGVKPGAEGEHLGLPVLPSVREAVRKLKPDATAIFVAAQYAASAIEEAIEAEVPLIVAVAEHIPLHDMMRIHSILQSQSKSRLVGANAPGIISAIGKCRIGFQPLSTFSPGHVGLIAKSGTLSYEAVGSLTRAGVGQSLCIAMGGDIVAGTNFVEALTMFENDPDTEGIVLIGEVGGYAEEQAAEWIQDYRRRVKNPKPIAALIGGKHARHDRVNGHAGAFPSPGEPSAEDKYRTLKAAGVTMVDHPEKFGSVMKTLMAGSGNPVSKTQSASAAQSRGFHTLRRPAHIPKTSSPISNTTSKRTLTISAQQAADLLNDYNIPISQPAASLSSSHALTILVDRESRSPALLVSPTANPSTTFQRSKRIPYPYSTGPSPSHITAALQHLQLDASPPNSRAAIGKLITTLATLFKEKEALHLSVVLSQRQDSSEIAISNPDFAFDDSAFRSSKRHPELHALRDLASFAPVELAAEPHGIVYVPLGSPSDATHNIGTLVNGAGLAMNTVDALALHDGHAANFLDTGGKATADTVKQSFSLILTDPRVKVVFVNIFGGLTLCDMIARGILLAFRELGLAEKGIPVVVRLRGTNEEEGQKIVAESGLAVEAFDGFEEAARRVVQLANGGK